MKYSGNFIRFSNLVFGILVCLTLLILGRQLNAQHYPLDVFTDSGQLTASAHSLKKSKMSLHPALVEEGDLVNLSYSLYETTEVSIYVTTLSGEVISQDDMLLEEGRFHWTIPTEDLLPGNYRVRVSDGKLTRTRILTVL